MKEKINKAADLYLELSDGNPTSPREAFAAGAAYVLKHIWHSVEYELPQDLQVVLVINADKLDSDLIPYANVHLTIFCKQCRHEKYGLMENVFLFNGYPLSTDDCTHWMAIPALGVKSYPKSIIVSKCNINNNHGKNR